jgi:hypothetical protein
VAKRPVSDVRPRRAWWGDGGAGRSLTVLLKEEQGKTAIVVDQMAAAKQMMDAAERESQRLRAETGSLTAQSDYQREVEAGLRMKEAAAESTAASTAAELQRTQQELQALMASAAENSRQAEQCVPLLEQTPGPACWLGSPWVSGSISILALGPSGVGD